MRRATPRAPARADAGPKKHQSRKAQMRTHMPSGYIAGTRLRCFMTRISEFPQRIVCLTEETTEALYLLGEDWRIVSISGFTVRPPRARKEKPRVSAFTSAKIDRIVALQPDLVLGFSDLQADIAAALVRHGIEVHVFNQRSVAEILRTIRTLAGLIGCEAKGAQLAERLEAGLDEIRRASSVFDRRPRV